MTSIAFLLDLYTKKANSRHITTSWNKVYKYNIFIMQTDYRETVRQINAKLGHLEEKHQRLQKRQDTIDNLALDTLFKMELLMGKINTVIVQNSRKQENSADLNTDNITLDENGGK